MDNTPCKPDYIFEVSWEVCNKVGGIHTVLCTKAHLLQQEWGDRLIMIGPDLHTDTGSSPEFIEDKNLFTTWKAHVQQEGLHVRTGRWNIPGQPLAILIDFTPFFQQKNEILTHLWVKFHLDSLNGQWDYIEPAMFGYAAGLAIAGFYRCHLNSTDKIIAQFHEWMTGAGVLYLEENVPQIATVFTTHATVLGRTLAGNGQPFYSRFNTFNAEQVARDFNVVSKHSMEKTTAATSDCFTCVSELTEKECEKFLDKRPDIITPNGFAPSFVPDAASFAAKRAAARQRILSIATALLQQPLADNSLLLIKSGRYEFRNKGIDVFIDAIAELNNTATPDRDIVAFIFVPAHHTGPRKLLQDSLAHPDYAHPRTGEVLTHNLQGADTDPILRRIWLRKLDNAPAKRVKIIFAPVYLNGTDGIFNLPYYDVLIGFDLAVFPSYYEPWGYTPLESLAFHIPAITTSVSGFGATVSQLPAYTGKGKGMYIIERNDENAPAAAAAIANIIREYAALPETEVAAIRESAAAISRQFQWEQLITRYYQAYDLALQKSLQREELFRTKPQAAPAETAGRRPVAQPVWRSIRVQPGLPPALQALEKISGNLWWSWSAEAASLFAAVDPLLWKQCGHNPLLLLKALSLATIRRLEKDAIFLDMLSRVSTAFDRYLQTADTNAPLIAYCSMEYGLQAGLKLYAGGLGVLAGDYLKAASDSNMHLVAIGLLYRQGYFKQKVSPQGEQLALPDNMDMDSQPLYPVYDDKGAPLLVQLAFPGRTVHAGVWKIMAGRIPLYLLDTDVAANNAADRQITAQLYNGEPDLRLQQELLLGIGGVRMLAALGIQPDIYHINEGHAAFTALERIRELMHAAHLDFAEALEIVRSTTQFTTHTALPAAMDLFSEEQLRAYLSYLPQDFNISWEQVMGLGRADLHNNNELFSMMYLAARCSQEINGVSRLHRIISCRLLQPLWKDFRPAELHIAHVTNGVHTPTWLAARWQAFWEKKDMTDNELWNIRRALKKDLVQALRVRLRHSLIAAHESPENIMEALDHLHENTLFIGFARRFAPYKRAGLLFTDMTRLARILNNSARPVQVIFAGKAHPKDEQAKAILKTVVNNSQAPALKHKVLFLEDYDMEMAAMMVQGVDVWLNTPQPGKEASGTSGMKAVLNGALHCSVPDGWWAEAYRADAGWALPEEAVYEHEALQDEQDAALLYSMLENEIVPLFFERNAGGMPEAWVKMIRTAVSEIAPVYSMQRVVADYKTCYEQLYKRGEILRADQYHTARELAAWKKRVHAAWNEIHVMAIEQPDGDRPVQTLGETFNARILMYTGSLSAEDIGVEVVFSGKDHPDNYVMSAALTLVEVNGRRAAFACSLPLTLTGAYTYSFRVFPKHPLLPHRQDFPLITWI